MADPQGQHPGTADQPRPWGDLSDSGLLWLINATVFHPRGFALALVREEDGTMSGWRILGDGSEPWVFTEADAVEKFGPVEALFEAAREQNSGG